MVKISTYKTQTELYLKYRLPAQVTGRSVRRQPAEQLRDGNAAAARGASAVEQHRQLGQLQPARPAARHHQGQQLQRHFTRPRPRGQHGQQQEHREALQNRQERQQGRDASEYPPSVLNEKYLRVAAWNTKKKTLHLLPLRVSQSILSMEGFLSSEISLTWKWACNLFHQSLRQGIGNPLSQHEKEKLAN